MLNWFGRRTTNAPIPDYRRARDIIAGLAGGGGVEELAEITIALESLTAAGGIQLDERFDEIHMLDGAGQERLVEMLIEYLATPRQRKQRESQLWGGAYNYLQALYSAYLLCLQRYEADPRGSMRFRARLPVTLARSLRALRLQIKWTLLRYATPEARIWTEMAGLYVFAESNGITDEKVVFYPGKHITVKQEFVKGLMIAASSNGSLRPAEQDIATRLVDHYADFFIMSLQPADGCTHWFDLKEPGPPVRNSKAPPENHVVRYFGAGAALGELEKVSAHIAYQRAIPPEVMFYPKLDDQVMLSALKHLEQDWAGKSQAREHERNRATARVTVVPGLQEILRALDFAINDSLDFTDTAAAESWVVEDVSDGGYLLKEYFQLFWQYNSAAWAGKFLDQWCAQVMRSKIGPLKKFACTIRSHRELLLNYFRAHKAFSSGVIEGLNNKAKVTMRKSYGFRTFRVAELSLYHVLGKLPEPKLAHRFY